MALISNTQINDLNIFVDRDLCYACGTCVERCILDNLALSVAPCRQACPLKMNCQGYIRLLAQGKEDEAVEEMRKASPFASILGRVCHFPCESECERGKVDEAVQIKALKRYLADSYPQISMSAPEIPMETGCSVAVVGSGPAGLSAAYELRTMGHQVTVFESKSKAGGLLRYGIPSFRLPEEEVDKAVTLLSQMGIAFKTGYVLGRKITFDDLKNQYDAILLATGASQSVKFPWKNDVKILDALEMLAAVKEGTPLEIGRRMAVIGGGNSAVDAALVGRRMGAEEVYIICLENDQDMPAFQTEIRQASEEGIYIHSSSGIIGINQGDDGSLGLELADCLSLFDDSGSFNPELADTCALEMQVDTLVAAIGQKVDTSGFPKELLDKTSNRLDVDSTTGQHATEPSVFSCGDCITGPSSVVAAMAAGKEVAISIDRFVKGDNLHWGRNFWNTAYRKEYLALHDRANDQPRVDVPQIDLPERQLSTEIERTYNQKDAVKEASRCLSCGRAFELGNTCWSCLPCEIECPVKALEVKMPYLQR